MNSQHLQIHAQDKAIQNPSMHEEGSKMPSPYGESTPTWTTVGAWGMLEWASQFDLGMQTSIMH